MGFIVLFDFNVLLLTILHQPIILPVLVHKSTQLSSRLNKSWHDVLYEPRKRTCLSFITPITDDLEQIEMNHLELMKSWRQNQPRDLSAQLYNESGMDIA